MPPQPLPIRLRLLPLWQNFPIWRDFIASQMLESLYTFGPSAKGLDGSLKSKVQNFVRASRRKAMGGAGWRRIGRVTPCAPGLARQTTARTEDLAVGHAHYLHASEKECTNVIVIRYSRSALWTTICFPIAARLTGSAKV